MHSIGENKVSYYNIMENEKVQKQQLKKIINLYEGGKYRCHTYSDVSNIIIFKNITPLRKKGVYCDDEIYAKFLLEIS